MMSRFWRYVNKVFRFGEAARAVCDSRMKPQIPTPAIFLSAWLVFVWRRRSLHALEADLRVPKRLDTFIGPRKPSVDRIGDVYALTDSESIRSVLGGVFHRLARNKALRSPWPMRFVTVDGHELFSQPVAVL